MTANNDSSDLEALFDSIAADVSRPAAAPAAPPPPPKPAAATDDSDDLQALFDTVASDYRAPGSEPAAEAAAGAEGEAGWTKQEAVFNRVGHMARELHDTIRELGYDKLVEETMSALPDAKDRLAYVANLTEQAACRVLNATDIAVPVVEDVEHSAKALGARWDKVFANQLGVDDFKALAIETRAYLNQQVPGKTQAIHAQLTEIMMAQDFQDLTGQVIKKVVELAQKMEQQLLSILLESMPPEVRAEAPEGLLNGPVVNGEGRSDVVHSQSQVDDLLESLGF